MYNKTVYALSDSTYRSIELIAIFANWNKRGRKSSQSRLAYLFRENRL